MKTVILGCAVAVLLGVGIYFALDDSHRATPGQADAGAIAHAGPTDDPTPQPAPPRAPRLATARATPTSSPAGGAIVATPFKRGDVTLRVGDGCNLDTGAILTGADADAADIVCADIRDDASLECRFGCFEARMPPLLLGPPPSVEQAYGGVSDAPTELPGSLAWVRRASNRNTSGIVLAGTRSGRCFKIILATVTDSPRVLEREITLRFDAVPSRPQGGRVHLDGQPEPSELSRDNIETLKRLRSRGNVPGDSFRSFLGTDFRAITEIPDHTTLPNGAHIAVNNPLQGEILIPDGGSVYATHGIGRNGKLKVKSYAGGLIEGDMDGEILLDSYAYVHITGNLNGTVDCRSYATVIVDGDVRGVLRVKSSLQFFLGGQFTDPRSGLDSVDGSRSNFYFSSFTSQSTIELFPASSSLTLHVRDSDLSAGKHEHIGRWREVIVADPLWARLR